jgi:hypothetical protein
MAFRWQKQLTFLLSLRDSALRWRGNPHVNQKTAPAEIAGHLQI